MVNLLVGIGVGIFFLTSISAFVYIALLAKGFEH